LNMEEAWSLVEGAQEHIVPPQGNRWMTLPHVDLAKDSGRRAIVERSSGNYLGHTDSVLVGDSIILITYALGHGGATALRRSEDGGRTWSERLPVPDDWSQTSDVPTIHELLGPDGVERLIVMQTFGVRGISNELRQAV